MAKVCHDSADCLCTDKSGPFCMPVAIIIAFDTGARGCEKSYRCPSSLSGANDKPEGSVRVCRCYFAVKQSFALSGLRISARYVVRCRYLLAGSSPCMFPTNLALGLASMLPALLDSSNAHMCRPSLLVPIENMFAIWLHLVA